MGLKEYKKLHAEWYELVSAGIDHRREIEFWARSIQEAGEPVLELGSGTGRVMVPLLERGFDVVGIDTSEAMTSRCLAACKARGLRAVVHPQSMLEFDLSQRFGLVILDSGGLGLFVSDEAIHATFERVMAHLKPGGLFIFEYENVPEAPERRDDLAWTGSWAKGPDDAVVAWRQRRKYNPTTHVWEILFVVEKFVGGKLIETELNERTGRFFTLEEAVGYAKSTGFEGIRATEWLTENPPTQSSDVLTVRCSKPAQCSAGVTPRGRSVS